MEKLLTRKEVAEKLSISIRTVDYWIAVDKIPYLKLSRKAVRFREADIEKWLNSVSNFR